MKPRLLIGTRGSSLAMAQAKEIVELLKEYSPGTKCEVVPIKTKGDKMHDFGSSAIEGKSLFTKEIESALTSGRVDVAVHSMKDVTTELPPGVIIGAVPKRVNPRDALISRGKRKLEQLPAGARVGTSSARRKAQLLAVRGDLEIEDMHGNIDTRLHKLENGDYDALVLAAAGLIRLGLEGKAAELLSTNVMLPAVGQGALAIQCREDDTVVRSLLSRLNDDHTRIAIEAERAFAKRLGASCRTAIAAYARFENDRLSIEGMVAASSGRMIVRGRLTSEEKNAAKVGEELAESLLAKGAQIALEAS